MCTTRLAHKYRAMQLKPKFQHTASAPPSKHFGLRALPPTRLRSTVINGVINLSIYFAFCNMRVRPLPSGCGLEWEDSFFLAEKRITDRNFFRTKRNRLGQAFFAQWC